MTKMTDAPVAALLNVSGGPVPRIDDNYVGYIYASRGGREYNDRYWLCVSDRDRMLHFLKINMDGEIVGCASYGRHAFEDRVPLGKMVGTMPIFDVEWFR